MKYIVMLGDGCADWPIESLGGRTPLEAAVTPTIDWYARRSEMGMVKTIPEGMAPGSDTANLSVLGYYPRDYYTGRSPLEALSIGAPMKDTDVAIRCNVVTLAGDGPYEEKTIIDHSSGEITTEEADELVKAVQEAFGNDEFKFYTGTSYRHCLIWSNGYPAELTAPHDILDRVIGDYLPADEKLRDMMVKSYDILKDHPVNLKRMAEGKNPANSLWFWGAGTKPMLSPFEEKYHKKGAMISAVDLLKGIAIGSDMKVVIVPGANGGLDTNYEGKANAAVNELLNEGMDFVYIHLEAPDEMGHAGSIERKIKSIENMDSRILKIIKEKMEGTPYRLLVMPDHPTPIAVRTHVSDPIPYMIYDSTKEVKGPDRWNEKEAGSTGIFREKGWELMGYFLES